VDYSQFPIFGGHPVSKDIVDDLERIDVHTRALMKATISQGAGGAKASNGTHTSGHCIDLIIRNLSNEQLRQIDAACKNVGAAPVLRLVGDDLGGGVHNLTEHLHIAFKGGSSNYAAVWANSHDARTRNWIEKQLKRRGR
jgi:hypothetical protein